MSTCLMPNGLSASQMALITAIELAMVPASPMPLTPSSFVGDPVQLTAPAASADADLAQAGLPETLSYQWSLVSRPAGSTAALNNPSDAVRLAARMEKDTAAAWRAVIEQAQSDQDRTFAVTALTQSAVLAAKWKQAQGDWPITTAFPGAD